MSDDKKVPPEGGDDGEGGEVVSLDEARRRAEEKQAATPMPPLQIDAPVADFLAPVMGAIAKELQQLADKDGVVHLGGEDEASRQKTAAVVRGLGQGLGVALSQMFAKWAERIEPGPEAEDAAGEDAAGEEPAAADESAPPGDDKDPDFR
jgi:hypothetical protein